MLLKATLAWAAITGAAEAVNVPGWLYMIVTLAGAGGLFRFYLLRSERRLANAGATKAEAEADEIGDRIRTSLMQEVESKLQRSREELQEAKAAEAEAIAEVKLLVARHERDRAEWKVERHAFVNDIAAKDLRITELERMVAGLQEQIRTMQIRLGYEEGRRDEDAVSHDRLAALEARTTVEEGRNDEIEARADRAQEKAEAQEKRNDDTPGHA